MSGIINKIIKVTFVGNFIIAFEKKALSKFQCLYFNNVLLIINLMKNITLHIYNNDFLKKLNYYVMCK